jgi:hypothetical protein
MGSTAYVGNAAVISAEISETIAWRSITEKLPNCGGTTACTNWYRVSSAAKPPTALLPGVGFLAKVANFTVCGDGYFVLRSRAMPATGDKVLTVDMAAFTLSRVIAAANLSNQATAWFSSTKRFLAKGAASWL